MKPQLAREVIGRRLSIRMNTVVSIPPLPFYPNKVHKGYYEGIDSHSGWHIVFLFDGGHVYVKHVPVIVSA